MMSNLHTHIARSNEVVSANTYAMNTTLLCCWVLLIAGVIGMLMRKRSSQKLFNSGSILFPGLRTDDVVQSLYAD
jgi:hypothetical protein